MGFRRLPLPILGAVALAAASDLIGKVKFGGITTPAAATAVVFAVTVVALPRVLVGGNRRALHTVIPFALFLVWTVFAAVRSGLTFDGVQNLTVIGLFVGLTAVTATYGRRHANEIRRLLVGVGWLIAGLYAISLILDGVGANSIISRRSFALQALVFMAVTVPVPHSSRLQRLQPWVFFILVAASLSRTALVVGGLMLAVRAAHGRTRRHAARPFIATLLGALALAWAIANVPALNDRFYGGDRSLNVAGITINGEGRSAIWEFLSDDISGPHLLGFGPGAASTALVEGRTGQEEPHNDYLRIYYDYGLIGVVLFVWAFAGALVRTTRASFRRKDDLSRAAPQTTAALALLGVAAAMMTDNVLIYSFVMAPCALLLGLSMAEPPLPRIPAGPDAVPARTDPALAGSLPDPPDGRTHL